MNDQGRKRERKVNESELHQPQHSNDYDNEELSIEFIEASDRAVARPSNSEKEKQIKTKTKPKIKDQERQEERAEARAWHLDRVRDKARRKK
jgi:hypothetical protein